MNLHLTFQGHSRSNSIVQLGYGALKYGDLNLTFKVIQGQIQWYRWTPKYDFLLVSISNLMSNAHRLVVIASRKFVSYVLSLGPNFDPPGPPLPRGNLSQNRITSSLGPKEASHRK